MSEWEANRLAANRGGWWSTLSSTVAHRLQTLAECFLSTYDDWHDEGRRRPAILSGDFKSQEQVKEAIRKRMGDEEVEGCATLLLRDAERMAKKEMTRPLPQVINSFAVCRPTQVNRNVDSESSEEESSPLLVNRRQKKTKSPLVVTSQQPKSRKLFINSSGNSFESDTSNNLMSVEDYRADPSESIDKIERTENQSCTDLRSIQSTLLQFDQEESKQSTGRVGEGDRVLTESQSKSIDQPKMDGELIIAQRNRQQIEQLIQTANRFLANEDLEKAERTCQLAARWLQRSKCKDKELLCIRTLRILSSTLALQQRYAEAIELNKLLLQLVEQGASKNRRHQDDAVFALQQLVQTHRLLNQPDKADKCSQQLREWTNWETK